MGTAADFMAAFRKKRLSNVELCQMFNVTKPTVHKALKKSINDGDLIVKPEDGGRSASVAYVKFQVPNRGTVFS